MPVENGRLLLVVVGVDGDCDFLRWMLVMGGESLGVHRVRHDEALGGHRQRRQSQHQKCRVTDEGQRIAGAKSARSTGEQPGAHASNYLQPQCRAQQRSAAAASGGIMHEKGVSRLRERVGFAACAHPLGLRLLGNRSSQVVTYLTLIDTPRSMRKRARLRIPANLLQGTRGFRGFPSTALALSCP
jgi:hypothetical protein